MKRSQFTRKTPLKPGGPLARGSVRFKSRRPKSTPIRKAARDQDCTIQLLGVCNFLPETTVLCHSNLLADGKGMGIKAPDTSAAFGCSACHDVLDGRAPRPVGMTLEYVLARFAAGVAKTRLVLVRLKLIKEEKC